jgi:hypothetical protein
MRAPRLPVGEIVKETLSEEDHTAPAKRSDPVAAIGSTAAAAELHRSLDPQFAKTKSTST